MWMWFVLMFERETVVGSNATSVFHWGSSSLTRLILSASTTAGHAKWIARKCLLLFNFYVTSIKYHKPLHLDDTVLKLSNLFTLWRWSGSGNKDGNTHTCYWNTAYTHQSQMSQDSPKAASIAFLQLSLLLHWLAKCQKYILDGILYIACFWLGPYWFIYLTDCSFHQVLSS